MTPTAAPVEIPSKRRLAVTTAISLCIAGLLLVTVVLPAEYGVDPLGTGRALGLSVISAPVSKAEAPPAAVSRKLLETVAQALNPGAFAVLAKLGMIHLFADGLTLELNFNGLEKMPEWGEDYSKMPEVEGAKDNAGTVTRRV